MGLKSRTVRTSVSPPKGKVKMPDNDNAEEQQVAIELDEPEKSKHFEAFHSMLHKKKKCAIFTHAGPDPDAIGSMMGLEWLLSKYGIECDLFFDGNVSHPQNKAVVNLLDPNMRPLDDFVADNYDMRCLTDTVPSHAGAPEQTEFDFVVDHHKENVDKTFGGVYVNLKAGSCAATIVDLIRESEFAFEEGNDYDSRVATALIVGIITDTEFQMSDDTTELEFESYGWLFEFRDSTRLKKIINYERPRIWIELQADAVKRVNVEDGIGVVGLGSIPGKHRDAIADFAQQMVTWEDVNTSVVFAMVEGCRVEGSVRSISASMSVPNLCKTLGGQYGGGGGKLGKGAYSYDLGGASFDDGDDDDTREEMWKTLDQRETKRVFKKIKDT